MRNLISFGDFPPVDVIFETGVLPFLLDFLGDLFRPYPIILRETLWIFANIMARANEENYQLVASSSYAERAIDLLDMEDGKILENVTIIFTILGDLGNC